MSRPWLLLAALCLTPVVAIADVPSPTIEGPIPGMPFVAGTTFDLSEVGYVEEEYFISGTATAFTNVGPLGSDGQWTVAPGDTAAYKTRILVHRPAKRNRFHGTVVVEWFNVSAGFDTAAEWIAAHTEMIREGIAWVGVSAQLVGVEGGPSLLGLPPIPLKTVNPTRYGSLVHPGDSFSYDIFSQAGEAIRNPAGPNPIGGFPVKALIAAGDSQSAFRLTTYADAIQPVTGVYDGFFIHSRALAGAALSQAPEPDISVPSPTLIRSDLDVPVFTLQSESDLFLLASLASRQNDSARFRLWEVAGTSHADTYEVLTGFTDLGDSPAVADIVLDSSPLGVFTCALPINSGPVHFVINAAYRALNRWVRRGTPPPTAPRLDVDPGPPAHYVLDAQGNVGGGVRTPQVDVPIAKLSGSGNSGGLACLLFGTTTPFDPSTLAALYPSHRDYVTAFDRATRQAVRAGFITRHDARLMQKAAALSTVGG